MTHPAQEPHEVILRMIETVDPGDTVTLDEIDAKVECFLQQKELKIKRHDEYGQTYETKWNDFIGNGDDESLVNIELQQYTRSRDALKAIRPEGWNLEILKSINGKAQARMFKEFKGFQYPNDSGKCFSTLWRWEGEHAECLAELWCIISAIDHARTHDGGRG